MIAMGLLIETVERLLHEAVSQTGKSETFILGASGVNSSQYYRCIRDKRLFSNPMLEAMGNSEYFNASYLDLLALKAIDEFGADALIEAYYVLNPDKRKQA